MTLSRVIAVFLAFVIVTLSSTAEARSYRVQPGDVLRVEVLEDPSLNRDVLVAPDGRVSIPMAGSVSVGGMTINQAQRRVTTGLASGFSARPNVLVSLLKLRDPPPPAAEPKPMSIYVIGEVRNPGLLEVVHGTTLLQTLSQAGGVTDFAAIKRIQLRRMGTQGGETVYKFNYKDVLDGISNVGVSKVHDGDVIVVPARRLFE
ncbi:MAG: polysaccharide biosynthesis/export family protein [Pseudomonadota bacterium]